MDALDRTRPVAVYCAGGFRSSIAASLMKRNGFDDVTSWVFVSDVFDLDDSAPFELTTEQKLVDLFGVEVGLTPVFVHVHVGFNVAEFVDFALGLFLLDVFGDDHVERPPTLPKLPEGR